MGRDKYLKQSLGTLYNQIKNSRVLLVGAGGIGCELLKNLVKTGYGDIHIIDLDTIDLSNLNRQFLFRHEHIKKPKALVAKEVAQRFNPNVNLVGHHANIKDAQFTVSWFSSFSLVFNALDNIDARRHVNKMCLAANVPLIESGTTGFNGQVQVIKKAQTACYDCTQKPTPKSYPVCTIRSTPSQPIHCIVWAKSYLFPELFGVAEDEIAELDTTTDSENAEEIKKLKEEAEALKTIKNSMGSEDFAKKVFDKVYKEDVERLASMEDMWKDKNPPTPLSYDLFAAGADSVQGSLSAQIEQRVWNIQETFAVFQDSLARLSKRLADMRTEALKSNLPEPSIAFDKDDDDTLDFVTASANLRSAAFAIEPKSKFETKQMAGNIIPAIATTNAMVASLCAFESLKVLRNEYSKTRQVYMSKGTFSTQLSDQPGPECVVCSTELRTILVRPEHATLKDLVEDVLKSELGYGTDFSVLNDSGGLIHDYMDEDDGSGNFDKKLSELGVEMGTFLVVKDDEGDEPHIDLQLYVEAATDEADQSKPVELVLQPGAKLEIPRRRKEPQTESNLIPPANGNILPIGKRKRDLEEEEGTETGTPAKKLQHSSVNDVKANGHILIDEENHREEGVIILD